MTLTLPATTDTIVGRTTTDTFTNKTLTAPTINGVVGGTTTSQTITTLTSTTVKDFTSVSGSAASTGSFGRLMLGGQTIKSTTEGIAIVDDSEAYTLLSPPAAFQVVSEVDNQWFSYFRNTESTSGENEVSD